MSVLCRRLVGCRQVKQILRQYHMSRNQYFNTQLQIKSFSGQRVLQTTNTYDGVSYYNDSQKQFFFVLGTQLTLSFFKTFKRKHEATFVLLKRILSYKDGARECFQHGGRAGGGCVVQAARAFLFHFEGYVSCATVDSAALRSECLTNKGFLNMGVL